MYTDLTILVSIFFLWEITGFILSESPRAEVLGMSYYSGSRPRKIQTLQQPHQYSLISSAVITLLGLIFPTQGTGSHLTLDAVDEHAVQNGSAAFS